MTDQYFTEDEFQDHESLNPAFWGLNEKSITLLELITYYFNGNEVRTSDGPKALGKTMDPQLDELLTVFGGEYDEYQREHDRLLEQGLVEKQTVCRKPIEWAPTEKGLRAISDVVESKTVCPDWADDCSKGPIFGDPNERLRHRKGVEIAGNLLPQHPLTWDITRRADRHYGVEWYPNGGQYDLLVDTREHNSDFGVEVITSTKNQRHLIDKYTRNTGSDRITLWVFGNRRQACEFFNAIYRDGYDVIETPFKRPGNWSAKAINRKVWREWDISGVRQPDSQDIIQTVTGLLNYDLDDLQELLRDYYPRNDTPKDVRVGG